MNTSNAITTFDELLAECARRGITFRATPDGQLRCRPVDAVDVELYQAIREHKPALLAWLGATAAETPPEPPAPVTSLACSRCDESRGWVTEFGAVVCSFCGQRQDAPCSEAEHERYHRTLAETRARLDKDLPQLRRWLAALRRELAGAREEVTA